MKRISAVFVSFVLLLSVLPGAVFAEEGNPELPAGQYLQGTDPAEPLDYDTDFYNAGRTGYAASLDEMPDAEMEAEYVPMTTGQSMVDILKDMEGFEPYPYWDYLHYSIGYGTGCGATKEDVPKEYWDGITKEKGEELLKEHLQSFENSVNRLCKKIGFQPTQQQFDAMMDFTYALGDAWTTGSMLRTYLEQRNTSHIDLVRAMGSWCRVGGSVSYSTCSRRIREAIIFLYGEYYLAHGSDPDIPLPVVKNDNLPYFKLVIYYGNGAYMINQRTDDVQYYELGKAYGPLPVPTLEGYTISGWLLDDGSYLKASDICQKNIRKATAQWREGSFPIPGDIIGIDMPAVPFTDVPENAWFYDDVKFAYEHDLMHGISATEFAPGMGMNRAMAVQILYNLSGAKYSGDKKLFQDVSPDAWYAEAVCWAASNGIVRGVGENCFAPDKALSRQDMMVFLHRYYTDYLGEYGPESADLTRFTDGGTVASYATAAVSWCVARGIVGGYDDGTLQPATGINRAQAAVIFSRFARTVLNMN